VDTCSAFTVKGQGVDFYVTFPVLNVLGCGLLYERYFF
jgi:hypothetical protein